MIVLTLISPHFSVCEKIIQLKSRESFLALILQNVKKNLSLFLSFSLSFYVPLSHVPSLSIHKITKVRKIKVLCFWTSFRVLRETKSLSKHFFQPFSTRFLLISAMKSLKKVWNEQKSWKRLKKKFWRLFGCAQHPKAGWKTQHQGQTEDLNSMTEMLTHHIPESLDECVPVRTFKIII